MAILWTFPDAAGKLPGYCADVAQRLFGDKPDASRLLRGYCANIARKLPGDLTGHFIGYRTDVAPETTPDGISTVALKLRDNFAGQFCEHRRLKNGHRGEASTLKPAQIVWALELA